MIPPGETVELLVTFHIAVRGNEFRDAPTLYLEDNGAMREVKLTVHGQAAPAEPPATQ